MSIPDYHISRVILEEHMNRQFEHERPRHEPPRCPERKRPKITRAVKSLIATSLYRFACMIDPAPAANEPAATGRTPQ